MPDMLKTMVGDDEDVDIELSSASRSPEVEPTPPPAKKSSKAVAKNQERDRRFDYYQYVDVVNVYSVPSRVWTVPSLSA